LKELIDSCFGKDGEPNGILGTAAQAVEQMAVPELKKTKPYTTFTGRLGTHISMVLPYCCDGQISFK